MVVYKKEKTRKELSRYWSVVFVNNLMKNGKKSIALKNFYILLEMIKLKFMTRDPLSVLFISINNIRPYVKNIHKLKGRVEVIIPIWLKKNIEIKKGIRSLVSKSRSRSEDSSVERLFCEVMDCFNYKGSVIKMKKDLYDLAFINKTFFLKAKGYQIWKRKKSFYLEDIDLD